MAEVVFVVLMTDSEHSLLLAEELETVASRSLGGLLSCLVVNEYAMDVTN